MKCLIFLLSIWISSNSLARGYNVYLSAGIDNVRENEDRLNASFGQFRLTTQGRLFRLHSAFTLLSGTEYMEGEAAIGLDLYLLTPFVDPKASIFPFLYAEGTAGVSYYQKAERQDFGYGYGAGVDLKMLHRSGLTFSVSQHVATETTIRYTIGLFWINE